MKTLEEILIQANRKELKDNPIVQYLWEYLYSKEGQDLIEKSVSDGVPPQQYLDNVLKSKFGIPSRENINEKFYYQPRKIKEKEILRRYYVEQFRLNFPTVDATEEEIFEQLKLVPELVKRPNYKQKKSIENLIQEEHKKECKDRFDEKKRQRVEGQEINDFYSRRAMQAIGYMIDERMEELGYQKDTPIVNLRTRCEVFRTGYRYKNA